MAAMVSTELLGAAGDGQCNWKISTGKNNTGDVVFVLPNNYRLDQFLGAGAYGAVVQATDEDTSTVVAIKKCHHVFQSRTLAKRTLRELRILRLLRHPNIIKLRSIILPLDKNTFSCLYLVFELMETDLYTIIRSGQTLTEKHHKFFTIQILRALEFLHANNILHRDLKPRNLLVNSDCLLKVADFGMARLQTIASNDTPLASESEHLHDQKLSQMTQYVTTRWYRAPEILMSFEDYGPEVDIWSVGCILAELWLRKPLFMGDDAIGQIHEISKLGRPPSKILARCKMPGFKSVFEKAAAAHAGGTTLESLLPSFTTQESLALLKDLLNLDSKVRISAHDAIHHPFLSQFVRTPEPPPRIYDQSLLAGEFSFQSVTTEKVSIFLTYLNYIYYYPSPYRFYLRVISPVSSNRPGHAHGDV